MSDCPHIICVRKAGDEHSRCKKCGEVVINPLGSGYKPEYLKGLAKSRNRSRERKSFDHKITHQEAANRRELGVGDGSWLEGRLIPHLHPKDPDRVVTSEKQMRQVYDKNGIDMDTAEVVDQGKFDRRLKEIRRKNRKPGWNKPQPSAKTVKSKE
jgi:hypothetical protein